MGNDNRTEGENDQIIIIMIPIRLEYYTTYMHTRVLEYWYTSQQAITAQETKIHPSHWPDWACRRITHLVKRATEFWPNKKTGTTA